MTDEEAIAIAYKARNEYMEMDVGGDLTLEVAVKAVLKKQREDTSRLRYGYRSRGELGLGL